MKSLEGEVARLEAAVDAALALLRNKEGLITNNLVKAVEDLLTPHESYQSRRDQEKRQREQRRAGL